MACVYPWTSIFKNDCYYCHLVIFGRMEVYLAACSSQNLFYSPFCRSQWQTVNPLAWLLVKIDRLCTLVRISFSCLSFFRSLEWILHHLGDLHESSFPVPCYIAWTFIEFHIAFLRVIGNYTPAKYIVLLVCQPFCICVSVNFQIRLMTLNVHCFRLWLCIFKKNWQWMICILG